MNRYITTITIVHEAESHTSADADARIMAQRIEPVLDESHRKGEIGSVEHVTHYLTKFVSEVE